MVSDGLHAVLSFLFTFPVSSTMGLRIAGDGRKATTVIWLTENQLANEILNSQEIVDEFLADINAE